MLQPRLIMITDAFLTLFRPISKRGFVTNLIEEPGVCSFLGQPILNSHFQHRLGNKLERVLEL